MAQRGRPPLLTPEFSAKVKPFHVGVYPTNAGDSRYNGFSYWNGQWWAVAGDTVEEAVSFKFTESSIQKRTWHGRARKPS